MGRSRTVAFLLRLTAVSLLITRGAAEDHGIPLPVPDLKVVPVRVPVPVPDLRMAPIPIEGKLVIGDEPGHHFQGPHVDEIQIRPGAIAGQVHPVPQPRPVPEQPPQPVPQPTPAPPPPPPPTPPPPTSGPPPTTAPTAPPPAPQPVPPPVQNQIDPQPSQAQNGPAPIQSVNPPPVNNQDRPPCLEDRGSPGELNSQNYRNKKTDVLISILLQGADWVVRLIAIRLARGTTYVHICSAG